MRVIGRDDNGINAESMPSLQRGTHAMQYLAGV
jgi:hypothetical protein